MADYKDNSNDRLEKLLAEYKKNNTIEKLTELAEELRDSKVHMPCRSDGNGRIAAMIVKMKDGKAFIPVYSNKWHLNGKMQNGTRVAVIPFTEVNRIAANEAKINKLDGIIINPQDSNIVVNMNFVNRFQLTQEESEKSGSRIPVDFRKAPAEPDNSRLEEQMSAFAAEKEPAAKQKLLNDILNTLRTTMIAVPLGKNKEGKDAPLVMTNNNTGEKYTPVYTSANFAGERHPDCKVAVLPFDRANNIAISMKSEVDGMCIVSRSVTVNLKTRLLENVKEVNENIKNNKAEKKPERMPADPVVSEQIKFTMKTLPDLLEKRGAKFMEPLLERRAAYIDELYENAYYDIRMYPFVGEEFTVTAITASPDHDAVVIEFPARGEGIGSAVRAYIVWDNVNMCGRYFAICRNADDALMIMEVSGGKQTCHGISAVESNEMTRILDIAGV